MRDLLFYSQHCKFSQHLIQGLHEAGLLQSWFTLVSVNTPGRRLPPFVDRVPLVYRHADRAVLVEEALEQYVRDLRAATTQTQTQTAQPQLELMAGYSDLLTDGKLSDTFGFLDESQQSPIENSSYGYLDTVMPSTNANAPTSAGTAVSTSQPSRFDQKEYDTYLSRRDADLNAIYSSRSKHI